MYTSLPIIICHIFVLSLILPSFAFIQEENETASYFPGTLDPCLTGRPPCPDNHACIGYLSGKLRNCYVELFNCLCVPYRPKYCSSSSECEPGNRCISFNSSSVCISCAATESVESFAPVDIPPPSQCVSQTEDPTHAPFDPTEAPFISPIFYQDPTPTFYIPLASPEGSLPPFPSFQSPLPEPATSFEPFPESSSSSLPFPDEGDGFAMDRCSNDSDCKHHQYTCRSLRHPLLRCEVPYVSCRCLSPIPVGCSHSDQCLDGEYCVWNLYNLGPKPDGSLAYCFSKKHIWNEWYHHWSDFLYFPPEDSPGNSYSVSTEPEESDIPEATGTLPEFSPYHFDGDDPNISSEPSYEVEPSFGSYPSYEPYFPSSYGYTLDRCFSKNYCNRGYFCVDVYHEDMYALCDFSSNNPCFCFPPEGMKACSRTLECEWGEVCADPEGEIEPFCISRDVVKRTKYFFEVENLPSFEPPYPTFEDEDPSVQPELEQLGRTLDTCHSHGDCAPTYTCNAILYFEPCKLHYHSFNPCVCIPDRKDACMDSSDCEDGEVCYPGKRVDFVPSFCISRSEANTYAWFSGLSPVVTRSILGGISGPPWSTWKVMFRSSNREIGPGLTGDVCVTSSDCESRLVCGDIYNYGEECTSTAQGKKCFCYPTYYNSCVSSLQCNDGEVCAIVQGLHDDLFVYESADPIPICLSQKAMLRNGYEEYNATVPREVIDNVLYADAPRILEKTLQNASIVFRKSFSHIEHERSFGREVDRFLKEKRREKFLSKVSARYDKKRMDKATLRALARMALHETSSSKNAY